MTPLADLLRPERVALRTTLRALLAERGPCTYAALEGPGRCDLPDPIAAGLELEVMREAGEVVWEGSPAVYRLVEAVERDPESPPVLRTMDVCGGSPRLANTRIPVWLLVASRVRLGRSDSAILKSYPTLQQHHLDAAWAYYNQHRDDINAEIDQNEGSAATEPDFWAIVREIWKARGGALPAQDEAQAQMERWRVLARPLLAHLAGESRVARAIALANAAGLYDAADALRYRGAAELDALAAHEARAPRPPAEMVDALQDRVHEDAGVARPAWGVKVPRGG